MYSFGYDLHMHSCLSPCGSEDMTPNNLVNMAAMCGCEILALTDHNTCRNAPAAIKAGEEAGVLVIPGMELCTSEEAHVVCLFETLEGALDFDRLVYENMPHIKNKTEIFGEQTILDKNDREIGREDNLLLVSSFIGVDQVQEKVKAFGGIAFPAHINRDSYSVVASLGTIPLEAGFTAAEITKDCDLSLWQEKVPLLKDLVVLRNSDSHYLETLAQEPPARIHLPEKSIAALFEKLRRF